MGGWWPGRKERLRREAAAWLARMEGEPGDADREAFGRWYAAEPEHAETYDRLARLWTQVPGVARSARAQSTSQPAAYPRRAARYGAAAALVLVMAALILVPRSMRPGAEPELMMLASQVGEIRSQVLSDGSRIVLDTDSAIRVRFDGTRRHVVLERGRARFEVAAARRPFVVQAGDTLVSVRGTVFDVGLAADRVMVLMLTGAASISRLGADRAGGPAAELRAGQVVTMETGRPAARPARASKAQAAWATGMLEFDGTPLDSAVREANRYSARKIRLADPALARLRVTGAFRTGDTAGLARALSTAFGLRLLEDQRGFVLHPGR